MMKEEIMSEDLANEEYKMVNVQLATDVREALSILKDRYGSRNMAEALREFIRLHDTDVLKDAQELVLSRMNAAQKGRNKKS
jgi:hypothetical protein